MIFIVRSYIRDLKSDHDSFIVQFITDIQSVLTFKTILNIVLR